MAPTDVMIAELEQEAPSTGRVLGRAEEASRAPEGAGRRRARRVRPESRRDRLPVRGLGRGGLVVLSALGALACGSQMDEDRQADEEAGHQEVLPAGGEPAMIVSGPDTLRGLAVYVLAADGSRTPGVFRGPGALLEAVSRGTFELRVDSVPPRVRVLRDGERFEPMPPGR